MEYEIKPHIEIKYNEDNTYILLKKRSPTMNRIIKINKTGNLIFQMLKKGYDEERIYKNIIIKNQNLEDVKKDINDFILQLEKSDILVNKEVNEKQTNDKNNSNYVYINELEKIQKKYLREGKVYKVFVEITYKCNLRCKHCYKQEKVYRDKNKSKFLDKKKIFDLFDEFEEQGVVEVFLTGGEPFLHPNIFEILEYGSKKNFLLTILTNANELAKEGNIDKIKNLNIYDIRISFYGTQLRHDMVTRVKGSYDKSYRALQFINKYMKIGTGVFVLTEENFDDCIQEIKRLKKENYKLSINPMITPTANGNMEPVKLRISIEQYRKFLQEIKIPIYGSSCSAGQNKLRIMADGQVIPCEYMEEWNFGNINENTFFEIIKGEKRKEFVKFISEIIEKHSCNKCNYRKVCNFCPAIFKIESGDYNKASEYICEISKEKEEYLKNIKKE